MIKKLFATILICFALSVTARAASNPFLGSGFAAVNGTSNSTTFAVGNLYFPGGSFTFFNQGLTATNSPIFYIQASIDNTNFVTVASTFFAVTNSTGFTNGFTTYPSYVATPIYFRVQAVSTNSVSLAGSYNN